MRAIEFVDEVQCIHLSSRVTPALSHGNRNNAALTPLPEGGRPSLTLSDYYLRRVRVRGELGRGGRLLGAVTPAGTAPTRKNLSTVATASLSKAVVRDQSR